MCAVSRPAMRAGIAEKAESSGPGVAVVHEGGVVAEEAQATSQQFRLRPLREVARLNSRRGRP